MCKTELIGPAAVEASSSVRPFRDLVPCWLSLGVTHRVSLPSARPLRRGGLFHGQTVLIRRMRINHAQAELDQNRSFLLIPLG